MMAISRLKVYNLFSFCFSSRFRDPVRQAGCLRFKSVCSHQKQATHCEWLVSLVSVRQFVERPFGLGEPVGPARFRGYGGESGEQRFELFEP